MKAKASGPVRAKIEDYFRRWHEDSDLGEGVRWVDLKKLTSFMLELSPGDSQIFSYFKFAEGQNELLSSHFAEAERHFRSALESQPNWPIAMNGIARACLRQRNYPCAEEFYRKAIQADPQWIFPHQNLGGLYMELNRLEESEREYRTAIQVNPNRAGSHYLIAQLYQRQKRLPEACVALKAALVLVGNQDRPPFDLALANRQLQRVCR